MVAMTMKLLLNEVGPDFLPANGLKAVHCN